MPAQFAFPHLILSCPYCIMYRSLHFFWITYTLIDEIWFHFWTFTKMKKCVMRLFNVQQMPKLKHQNHILIQSNLKFSWHRFVLLGLTFVETRKKDNKIKNKWNPKNNHTALIKCLREILYSIGCWYYNTVTFWKFFLE